VRLEAEDGFEDGNGVREVDGVVVGAHRAGASSISR
jgi:hypothetical protein